MIATTLILVTTLNRIKGASLTQSKPQNLAVLTSDIVHSTSMSPKDYALVMKSLKGLLQRQQQKYHCKFEIFRGDSFQILYPECATAMQSALSIRLYLQSGIDCPASKLTQSLAIGKVKVLSDTLGSSIGEAFILSGRELDKASRGSFLLNFPAQFDENIHTADLSLSTLFLRHLIDGLTEKQAEVLFYYINMDCPEQKSIAEMMNMTRQNVATHLKRGGAELVKAYLNTYQKLFSGHQQ
jgi:predicted DNA-binding protein YlxM (UPF0122 family)